MKNTTKIESLQNDINSLERALKIVEKTTNYSSFNKSSLIFELCEQINILKEKRDNTINYLNKLKTI